jgi:hypothetical protein
MDWIDRRFDTVMADLRRFDHHIDVLKDNMEELKTFLSGKRDFLLRLLENQNLLELRLPPCRLLKRMTEVCVPVKSSIV